MSCDQSGKGLFTFSSNVAVYGITVLAIQVCLFHVIGLRAHVAIVILVPSYRYSYVRALGLVRWR